MNLNLEDGYEVYMARISKGTGYADAVFRHERSSSEFYGAETAWNGNGWTMTFRDGGKIYFPESYYARNFAQGAPTEMLDAQGHRIQLKRNSVRNLEELISPVGTPLSSGTTLPTASWKRVTIAVTCAAILTTAPDIWTR